MCFIFRRVITFNSQSQTTTCKAGWHTRKQVEGLEENAVNHTDGRQSRSCDCKFSPREWILDPCNGWKTQPESLQKPGRISGKQTEQVIFQRLRTWRLEDVSALIVLAAGTHVHCHLAAATMTDEVASSGKKSVYRKMESCLKLRRNGKRKFTSGCFFFPI